MESSLTGALNCFHHIIAEGETIKYKYKWEHNDKTKHHLVWFQFLLNCSQEAANVCAFPAQECAGQGQEDF